MLTPVVLLAQLRDFTNAQTGETCLVQGVPTLKCFEVIFSNFLIMSSALVVFALFIMFVVGAFTYLTSLGNPEKVKKAQATFRYAIIGLILFISSYLILKLIDVLFLGGNDDIFRFSIPGP